MRWSYKTVHYELQKEGLLGSTFLDESEVEQSLNEYGKAGWELVSILETMDGLIAVFKQPLSYDNDHFSSHPREKAAANLSAQPEKFEDSHSKASEGGRKPIAASGYRFFKVDKAVEDHESVDEKLEDEPSADVGSIRIE